MSDPITNVEIEDVLASIRRLVSTGEQNSRSGAQKRENTQGERLVLTPALRVTEPPRTEPANAQIAPWGPFSAGRTDSSKAAAGDTGRAASPAEDRTGAQAETPPEAPAPESRVAENTAGLTLSAEDLAEADLVDEPVQDLAKQTVQDLAEEPAEDLAKESVQDLAEEPAEDVADEPVQDRSAVTAEPTPAPATHADDTAAPRADTAPAPKAPVDADDEEAVGAFLSNVLAAVQTSNAYASFGPIAATVALAERRRPEPPVEDARTPTAALDTGPDTDETDAARAIAAELERDRQAEENAAAEAKAMEPHDLGDEHIEDVAEAETDTAPQAEPDLAEDLDTTAEPDTAEDLDTMADPDLAEELLAEAEHVAPAEPAPSPAQDVTPAAESRTAAFVTNGAGALVATSAASRAPDIASTVRKSIEEAIAELERRANAEDDEYEPDGSEPPLLPRIDEDRSLHDLVTSEDDDDPQDVLSWDDDLEDDVISAQETPVDPELLGPADDAEILDQETVEPLAATQEAAASVDPDAIEAESEGALATLDQDMDQAEYPEPEADMAAEDAAELTGAHAAEPADLTAEDDAQEAEPADLTAGDDAQEAAPADLTAEDDAQSAESPTQDLDASEDETAAIYPTASEDEDTTADPEDSSPEAGFAPQPRSPFGRIPQMARAAFAKSTWTNPSSAAMTPVADEPKVAASAPLAPETAPETAQDIAPEIAQDEGTPPQAGFLDIDAGEAADNTDAAALPDGDASVAETPDTDSEQTEAALAEDTLAADIADVDLPDTEEPAKAETAASGALVTDALETDASLDAEPDGLGAEAAQGDVAEAEEAPMSTAKAIAELLEVEAEEVTAEAAPEPPLAPETEPETAPEPEEASDAAQASAQNADDAGRADGDESAAAPTLERAPEMSPEPAEADTATRPAGADIHQFATVRAAAAQRGSQIAASPDLDDDTTIAALYEQDNYLDEQALRDLVGDIVREELQGVLGERITRNVRKLVRREIHRILNSQDFD